MGSLKEKAYDLIKSRILDSTYKPNEFLDEKRLTEELSLSRTPVREAMIELSREGFLEIIPKRGIRVVPLSADDVISIFEIRDLVEPWLALTYGPTISKTELLKERELVEQEINYNRANNISMPGISINHHPHTLLVNKCENKYIQNMLRHVEDQGQRTPDVRRAQMNPEGEPMSDEQYDTILENHMEIIDELLNENYQKVAALLKEHVAIAKEQYMRYWFGNA